MTTIVDARAGKFVVMDVSAVLANLAAKQAATDIVAYSDATNGNYFFGPAGVISPDRVSGALTGQANFGIGGNALGNITTGGNNTAVGRAALASLLSTGGNTAFGESALQFATVAVDCSAFGHNAAQNIISGIGSSAFGKNSQRYTTIATGNSSFGDSSMRDNTTGIENSAFGYGAMAFNITGTRNCAFGYGALYEGTAGSKNVSAGMESLEFNEGDDNVAVGDRAGRAATSADTSTFVGSQSGTSGSQKVDAQNSTAIGYNSFTDKNNQVVIGNTSVTETVLRGVQRSTVFTVAGLPTASSVGAGARAFVSNANATTFASVVAGGGSNNVPVYSDGSSWRIG